MRLNPIAEPKGKKIKILYFFIKDQFLRALITPGSILFDNKV
jgi:hypothetical protein